MQYSAVLLAGFAALTAAQTYTGPAVTNTVAPPPGCTGTAAGTFELSVANITTSGSAKVKVSRWKQSQYQDNNPLIKPLHSVNPSPQQMLS